MSQRILLTGHLGYIGAVMTPFLQGLGHEIVGLDVDYYQGCDMGPLMAEVPTLPCDLRDVTAADLAGFDAVIHLAALCNDPIGDMNPHWTYDINHLASVRLAEAAKAAGVGRYLYASSCSMYGTAGEAFVTEEAPLNPLTPYADSKVKTERDVAALADDAFSPVFMRNATAYGFSPRLRADIVLNNLVGWAVTTGQIQILSDGTPWRPIVHIEDIARAFAAALEAPRDAIHNQAFNVGVPGENYQVKDLAAIVQALVPECEVTFGGQGGADPRDYRVDFGKIGRVLPLYQPAWTAARGAAELLAAYRAHGLSLEDFQGRRFVRLKALKHLLETQGLDADLRVVRVGEGRDNG